MTFKPEKDGIDHINVYSQGKTQLGQLLSNFADTPFDLEGKGHFRTVEGFWYWTMTGFEEFRELPGWQCKTLGNKCRTFRAHPTESELLEAYRAKLSQNSYIGQMLLENSLPLAHYYVYSGKVVEPKEWQWTAQIRALLKEELRSYGK